MSNTQAEHDSNPCEICASVERMECRQRQHDIEQLARELFVAGWVPPCDVERPQPDHEWIPDVFLAAQAFYAELDKRRASVVRGNRNTGEVPDCVVCGMPVKEYPLNEDSEGDPCHAACLKYPDKRRAG